MSWAQCAATIKQETGSLRSPNACKLRWKLLKKGKGYRRSSRCRGNLFDKEERANWKLIGERRRYKLHEALKRSE